jgi:hypothetical protein
MRSKTIVLIQNCSLWSRYVGGVKVGGVIVT